MFWSEEKDIFGSDADEVKKVTQKYYKIKATPV